MSIRAGMMAVAAWCAAPAAPAAAVAQDAASDTFDLARAVAVARASSPRIAAAAAGMAAATARIGPAGALPDPTLSLGAMNYMLPSLSARRDPLSMNQITLMQVLPVNGTLGLRRAAARFDSAGAASRRDAVLLDVEREARARYWDLYHIDRALEVMDRTLAVLRELSGVATTMYAVGSTVQSDVVRSQTAITRMHQEIAEMRLQRTTAAAALNAVLGRPAESGIVIRQRGEHADHVAVHPLQMPPLPPLDSLVALAEERSPEIAEARAMLEAARSTEAVARRMIYPDLGLGVAYGQRPGAEDMVSAMVSVSLPLFARSRQLAMRDEASAMRTGLEEDLRGVRLTVRRMLATAYAEAETARRQVELYAGSLVPQAWASYEAALSAYRVGRSDFLAALEAQMALLMYQHDLHRYEARYGTAVAELDRLIGRPFGTSPSDREE